MKDLLKESLLIITLLALAFSSTLAQSLSLTPMDTAAIRQAALDSIDGYYSGDGARMAPEMVFVKGGSFKMGSTRGGSDEMPVHTVFLDDFYMGKLEVTQAEWYKIMPKDASDRYFPGCDSCPVERVTWDHVLEFIEILNATSGMNYRLPTEAEWEYAARGGQLSKGYKYSGSNIADSVAWTDGNAGNRVHPGGWKKPNELGIFDMSGNVFEWCYDWYSPEYYEVSPNVNPKGPETGTQHVMRGGSWFFDRAGTRIADRDKGNPCFRYGYVGFRLCRSADN